MTQSHMVDGDVWQAISGFLTQPRQDLLAAIGARRTRASAEAAAWAKDQQEATRQLEQLESAELAIMDRFRRALISEPAMDRHLRDVAARRAMLQNQVASARAASSQSTRRSSLADSLAALVDEIRAKLPRLTAEERRDLVATLVPAGGLVLGAGEVRVRLLFESPASATGSAAPTGQAGGIARPWSGDTSLPWNEKPAQGGARAVELRVAVGGKRR